MKQAEIIETTPDHSIASWRDAFIIIFHRNTTVAGVKAIDRVVPGFAESRRNGMGLITIVEEKAPMPPSDARDALATALEAISGQVRVSAVAFEGTGFRAAAVRSVVAGLTMVARQTYPHKVFATVDEAAAWMAPQLPTQTSVQEFSGALTKLREAIAQRAAGAGAAGA